MVDKSWPREIALAPYVDEDSAHDFKPSVVLLLFNLTFLYILTLNGLARSMSDLAQLTKKDGKSRCNIKPEWSQLNQDFNQRYYSAWSMALHRMRCVYYIERYVQRAPDSD
jgi:hypothetical protein